MELAALRSYREVCRQASISRAAEVLGYTQSAVSRQIAALERQLDSPLLERHARGVRPTAAGAILLDHAHAIVARADRAAEEVAAAGRRRSSRLRVGAVPTAAATLLPRALTRFAADDPSVRVTFTEDVTPQLLPRLQEGELDVAVVTDYPPGLPAMPGIDLVPLLDDPLRLLLPLGHRLAGRTRVDLAELADETWVEDYSGSATLLTGLCARAGFTPRLDIDCGSLLGKQAFVAAGLGITLVPDLLVPALRTDVLVRDLTEPPTRTVHAALRPHDTPAARFVTALRDAAVPAKNDLPATGGA
ncbi:LysR family transcriptional regulator [Kitasatospora sp. KL5]|uniref:LysR family transcriptional regulator n=1 Tax=Kitasatospora sp. KL5 TaxID=3425125 RepID=UPI003D6FF875